MPNKQVTPTRQPETGGAREFLASRLTPDPNNPHVDTFHLHFPRAVEEVEGRQFWLTHLPELLDAYAATKNDEDYKLNREAVQIADERREAAKLSLSKMKELLERADKFTDHSGGGNDPTLHDDIRAALEPPSGGEKGK